MKKILIALIFLTAGSLQAAQGLARIMESVMGNAPKTIDGKDYVGQYVRNDKGSGSTFVAAGKASDTPKGRSRLTKRNPNSLAFNFKKCLFIVDKNSLLCFKKKGGMSEIYPATPIPDPDGNTFVPIIGSDNNGNLTIKNPPSPSTIVQGDASYQSYLVFGSFGERLTKTRIAPWYNTKTGIFNADLFIYDSGFKQVVYNVLTKETPSGKQHTPKLTIETDKTVKDTNTTNTDDYEKLIAQAIPGSWSSSCIPGICGNGWFSTNCPTGNGNCHKSFWKRTNWDHARCRIVGYVKLNSIFKKMIKKYTIGNKSGHLYWQTRGKNPVWYRPVIEDE